MNVKAVIFDAGGVIIKQNDLWDCFVKVFKPRDVVRFKGELSRFLGPLCRNEISEKEYWQRIAQLEGVDRDIIPGDLWTKYYEKTTRIDQDIIGLIKDLQLNYKMILVSNTIKSHASVNRKRKLFEHFDDVINSNEVNLSKDSVEIFVLALERNHLDASDCIFIDDVQEFVDIANSIGIYGILYHDVNQLTTDLASVGVILEPRE